MDKTLQNRLRLKASIMQMGEKIAWGSDTDLMYEAAEKIDSLEARIKDLELDIEEIKYDIKAIYWND